MSYAIDCQEKDLNASTPRDRLQKYLIDHIIMYSHFRIKSKTADCQVCRTKDYETGFVHFQKTKHFEENCSNSTPEVLK